MNPIPELHRHGAAAAVFIGLLLAGTIDYCAGNEIRVYPLYFVPVCIAAWHFGVGAIVMSVIAASAIWASANFLAGLSYSAPYIWPINILAQFVTFGFIAALFHYARALLNRERVMSHTDRTTGLANSRGFYAQGHLALASCRRHARPLTLAYIDLDNFKWINDRFGHERGDEVLLQVADIMKCSLRSADVLARIGGDEFAILMPETSADQAAVALERVRARLSAVDQAFEGKVSASIGAISWREPPLDIQTMLSAADKLMYRAKSHGKNRLEVASVGAKLGLAPSLAAATL